MDEKTPIANEQGSQEQDQGKDQRSQDRLKAILSSMHRGWQVTILRGKPGWCRGHLETIEYYGEDDEETIDVDYLIRQWGGHKLNLKVHDEGGKWVGGGSISLFSYPPKVRGQILNEAEMYGMTPGPQGTFSPSLPQHPYPMPPPQPGFDVAKLFEMASNQKGANLESVMKMMETFRAQMPQPQPVDPMAGMQQMMGMAQAFKQMREIFGDLGGEGGGGGGGGDDGITPIAAEVVKALVSSQQHPAPTHGALTAPRPGFPGPSAKNGAPPPNAQTEQNAPRTAPAPNENIERGNIMQIAKRISDLEPDDAAGCVHLAFEGMPQDKRDQAAQAFMRQMASDEEDDGQGRE